MSDSISKTALLAWLMSQLAEVAKAKTVNANSYRQGMSGANALARLQEETQLAVRADMLQDAITLIEQYQPEQITQITTVEFNQFAKTFEEWAEAHTRAITAEKALEAFDRATRPIVHPDGDSPEVEEKAYAEFLKWSAVYEAKEKPVQHLRNIACLLAYRVSVLYPAISKSICCAVAQIGKYAVCIEPVIDPFTKKSSLRVHWMKWESGKDLPVHGFMEQAESATIE